MDKEENDLIYRVFHAHENVSMGGILSPPFLLVQDEELDIFFPVALTVVRVSGQQFRVKAADGDVCTFHLQIPQAVDLPKALILVASKAAEGGKHPVWLVAAPDSALHFDRAGKQSGPMLPPKSGMTTPPHIDLLYEVETRVIVGLKSPSVPFPKRRLPESSGPGVVREWSERFLKADSGYIEGARREISGLIKAGKSMQHILDVMMAQNRGQLAQHDLEELIAEIWTQELKRLASN